MATVFNGRVYDICPSCSKAVRLDKTFFGSLHACVPTGYSEEDKELLRWYARKRQKELANAKTVEEKAAVIYG